MTVLAIGCAAAALCLIAAGVVPFEMLERAGSLVRRPDDVTPERYHRYLQVCWAFAAVFGALGWNLWQQRRRVGRQMARFGAQARRWGRRLPQAGFDRPLGLLLSIGAALRLYYLNVPIAYDEAYSFLNFARFPWYIAIADYNNTNNHVLNTFLMHWCYRLFGQEAWALRLSALAAGMVLLLVVYPWAAARFGRPTALVAVLLTATSGVLIDYSVNARGYIFVAAAAVVFDACLEHAAERRRYRALAWVGAWLAFVLGLWAMPIMVYPLMGSCAWLVLSAWRKRRSHSAAWKRTLRSLVLLILFGAGAVAVLYAPAYVFRGFLAARNPFLHSIGFEAWLAESPGAWAGAFARWTAGPIPSWVWLGLLSTGAATALASKTTAVRALALFATTLVLMALHRVAPPPRLFVFMTPWVLLLCARGAVFLTEKLDRTGRLGRIAAGYFSAAMLLYFLQNPVLIDPEQRAPELLSIDEVVRFVVAQQETDDRPARILAPLPCDLPALYHLARMGIAIPVNGQPGDDDRLYVIVPHGKRPEATFADSEVRLPLWRSEYAQPRQIADFSTVSLWVTEPLRTARHGD